MFTEIFKIHSSMANQGFKAIWNQGSYTTFILLLPKFLKCLIPKISLVNRDLSRITLQFSYRRKF